MRQKAVGGLGALRFDTVDGPLTDDTITFDYDALGRMTGRAVNGVGATQTFDALDRVTSETNPTGTFSIAYVDASERVASVTYPNGQITSYAYYPNAGDNRLQTMWHKGPGGATLSKFDYTLDAAGNVTTWTQQADNATPTVYSYTYDRSDELVRAVLTSPDLATTFKRFGYTYDAAGNRTSEQIDDSVRGATYDALDRLVTRQPGGTLRVAGQVDESAAVAINGKPAVVTADGRFEGSLALGGGTTAFSIAAVDGSGNQQMNTYEVDAAGATTTYAYDANGNLVADGVRTFEWDAQNQLIAINQGTHRSEFSYDGEHRRVRIVERENTAVVSDQQFIWLGDTIAERRTSVGSSGTTRAYTFVLDDNGASRYLTRDHLMSIRDVSDGSGALSDRYEYTPFGTVTKTFGSGSNSFEFTGVLAHGSSGLLLMERRLYDPDAARWLSEDPLGLRAGPNLYAYVRNNPLKWYDPAGTMAIYPNGNWKPGFDKQDDKCSGVFSPLNSVPCLKKCCQDHDDCYASFQCNQSSWLSSITDINGLPSGPCDLCNMVAGLCVVTGGPRGPCAEPKCR